MDHVNIRRPLQSVERVRLHSKPPSKQPASQQGKAARQQGSKAARQPGVSHGQPASQAARQQGSKAATYLLIGDSLSRHRLPQAATGCQTPSPPHLPMALKSVLPPAQESQKAYFGCPGEPSASQMPQKA